MQFRISFQTRSHKCSLINWILKSSVLISIYSHSRMIHTIVLCVCSSNSFLIRVLQMLNFDKGTHMNNHTKVTNAFMKIWCISPNWMWETDTGILENAGCQKNNKIHFSINRFLFSKRLEDEIKLKGVQRQGYKPLIDHKLSPLTSVDHSGCYAKFSAEIKTHCEWKQVPSILSFSVQKTFPASLLQI